MSRAHWLQIFLVGLFVVLPQQSLALSCAALFSRVSRDASRIEIPTDINWSRAAKADHSLDSSPDQFRNGHPAVGDRVRVQLQGGGTVEGEVTRIEWTTSQRLGEPVPAHPHQIVIGSRTLFFTEIEPRESRIVEKVPRSGRPRLPLVLRYQEKPLPFTLREGDRIRLRLKQGNKLGWKSGTRFGGRVQRIHFSRGTPQWATIKFDEGPTSGRKTRRVEFAEIDVFRFKRVEKEHEGYEEGDRVRVLSFGRKVTGQLEIRSTPGEDFDFSVSGSGSASEWRTVTLIERSKEGYSALARLQGSQLIYEASGKQETASKPVHLGNYVYLLVPRYLPFQGWVEAIEYAPEGERYLIRHGEDRTWIRAADLDLNQSFIVWPEKHGVYLGDKIRVELRRDDELDMDQPPATGRLGSLGLEYNNPDIGGSFPGSGNVRWDTVIILERYRGARD